LNTPAVGRPCDDGNVCTETDTCDALGSCVGGAVLDCNDVNVCTDDSCDMLLGCQNVPVPGRACDDARDCTTNDTCDSAGQCAGDGSFCSSIPTMSNWGFAIMVLLILTAGTFVISNTKTRSNASVCPDLAQGGSRG